MTTDDDMNVDVPMSDTPDTEQAPLSAPGKPFGGDDGAPKKGGMMKIVLLLVLLGVGAGGYVFLSGGGNNTPMPVATITPDTPLPDVGLNDVPPSPMDMAGDAMSDDLGGIDNDPMMADMGLDDGMSAGDMVPELPGSVPPMPVASMDGENAIPPVMDSMTGDAMPAVDDMMADMDNDAELPPIPEEATQIPSDIPVVEEENTADTGNEDLFTLDEAVPGEVLPTNDVAQDGIMDGTEIATDTNDMPLDSVVTPSDVAPPSEEVLAEIAAENAPTPSDAEIALVQNAEVLDQLSKTVTPDDINAGTLAGAENPVANQNLDQIKATPAIVRPLPNRFVVVKKESDAGDVDSRLTAARRALSQGRTTVALQLFDELSAEFPKDNRILMGRALSLQKMGQVDGALLAYEDVLTNDPRNLEALTNMLGLIKTQNPTLAVDKLRELRNTYPYNADITAQLGIALGEMKNYPEAARYLDMAEALDPDSAYVLYNKAVLYDKMGNKQEAGALYRQIIRMNAEGRLNTALPIDVIKRRLSSLN